LATICDPLNFQYPRHIQYLNQKIVEVCRDHRRGLLVMLPPQHGKSTILSRWTPGWYLGNYPNRRVILVTYGSEYSKEYGGFVRTLMEDRGQELFGVQVAQDTKAKNKWRIEGSFNGGMDAEGHQGQITGKPGDLLLMDDLVKNSTEAQSEIYRNKIWDTYQSVINTRRSPVASQILLMTHWHRLDIAGRIMDMCDGSPTARARWEIVRLPALAHENDPLGREPGEALWPERYSKNYLEELRDSTSPYWWSALYDCHPISGDMQEWPNDYFEGDIYFDEWPSPNDIVFKIIALDPSKGKKPTSDFSAFVMLAIGRDGTAYVDADLERRPSEVIKEHAGKLMKQFEADLFVLEGNAWQDELMDPILLRMQAHGVERGHEKVLIVEHFSSTGGSKVERIRASTIGERLKTRYIKFKRNSHGVRLLVEQLREFPMAEHDDGPDALEMALAQVGNVLNGSHRERREGVIR
jgi:predicted phage terminase large subunit-like protein